MPHGAYGKFDDRSWQDYSCLTFSGSFTTLEYLGKKGKINDLFADFKKVPNNEKKEVGQSLNHLKQDLFRPPNGATCCLPSILTCFPSSKSAWLCLEGLNYKTCLTPLRREHTRKTILWVCYLR